MNLQPHFQQLELETNPALPKQPGTWVTKAVTAIPATPRLKIKGGLELCILHVCTLPLSMCLAHILSSLDHLTDSPWQGRAKRQFFLRSLWCPSSHWKWARLLLFLSLGPCQLCSRSYCHFPPNVYPLVVTKYGSELHLMSQPPVPQSSATELLAMQ